MPARISLLLAGLLPGLTSSLLLAGLLPGLTLLLVAAQARADALVVTQAMLATTIAEFTIEEDRVEVDLEIGQGDFEAFRNLLPDDLYAELGHPPAPWPERIGQFFERDFGVAAGDGPRLTGRLLLIEPRLRVRRDVVSGEPLPAPEGEDEETILFVRLEFPLPVRPDSLTLFGTRGSQAASVGFVAYHGGIAVNDFRYLGPSQTLDLDWDDPWYTRFRARALVRRYFAPMSGFIYVEPYEVRKEIIARPLDLQHWIDLGLEGREVIPAQMQPELQRRVAEFLRGHQKVIIDGREIEPELARVNFLERTLRTSRVIDPPVDLDIHSAVLGVIFVYPTEGLPGRVTMDWDLWNDQIQRVPVSAVDQAGPLPSFLEPDWRVLEWQNFLKHPDLPTARALEAPPGPAARALLLGRWLLLAVAFAAVFWLASRVRAEGRPRTLPALAVSLGVVSLAIVFWLAGRAQLSPARSEVLVSALLHNVYLAFDYREEGRIYDVLAQSVDGELLADIYLETRRGLELANQGGARAKVKEIELVDLAAEHDGADGFVATATWIVAGSVGHWGHVHQRKNRYRAELRVAPVDGAWKLTGLEILEEERL